jgi:hypothetical protein
MATQPTPYFSGDYAAAMLALGEDCPYREEDFDARRPEFGGVPALILDAMRNTDKPRLTFRLLKKRAARVGARKALESIGIHCEQHIVGIAPQETAQMPLTISATVQPETAAEASSVAVTPLILVDDIEDPPVPPGTIDARPEAPSAVAPTVPPLPENLLPLAHGFCQYLQAVMNDKLEDAGRHMVKDLGVTLDGMSKYIEGVIKAQAITTPYQMAMQVTTPQGFPMTLTVTKATAEELIPAMGKLGSWLVQNGYTVPQI